MKNEEKKLNTTWPSYQGRAEVLSVVGVNIPTFPENVGNFGATLPKRSFGTLLPLTNSCSCAEIYLKAAFPT